MSLINDHKEKYKAVLQELLIATDYIANDFLSEDYMLNNSGAMYAYIVRDKNGWTFGLYDDWDDWQKKYPYMNFWDATCKTADKCNTIETDSFKTEWEFDPVTHQWFHV